MKKTTKVAATEPATTIIAYKGFDAQFRCRGFQYKVGQTYEHTGDVLVCHSGFHAYENALDVFSYYGPTDAVFARVELSGEISRNGPDSKVAAGRIKIAAQVAFPGIVSAAVKWISDACGLGDIDKTINASKLASSGNASQLASSGYDSKLASSGYASKLASSGNASQLASSGNASKLASSGSDSQLASSGNDSKLASSGNDSVCMAAGLRSTAMVGANGAIALAWNDGTRVRIAVGYEGEGEGLQRDTLYFVNASGKFEEVK